MLNFRSSVVSFEPGRQSAASRRRIRHVEIDPVFALREVGDRMLTLVASEDELVLAGAAGHGVARVGREDHVLAGCSLERDRSCVRQRKDEIH